MKQLSFINKDGSLPIDKYRFVKIPDNEYCELIVRSEKGQEEPAIVFVNGANIVFSVKDIVETPYGITAIAERIIEGEM